MSDTSAIDPTITPDPASAVASAPPAAAVTADPAVDPAPELPLEAHPEPAPKPRAPDPLISTITGLRAKNRELESRAERSERQAAEATALAERLARRDDPATPPRAEPVAPSQPQFEQAVRTEAQRQRIAEDSVSILNAGNSTFRDFAESRNILTALGAFETDDFVSDLVAVDKSSAHLLIDKLAKDPERAAAVVGMDSRRRIAELTRMAMTAPAAAEAPTPGGAPPPKPAIPARTAVSRAPAPAPAVTPSTHKEIDGYSDDATDDQFTEKFNRRMKERSVAR